MKLSLPFEKYQQMAGIYLHIPFCKQACHYCDFHFSTNTSTRAEMVHALVTELTLRKDYLNQEPVETIYFGGGTPSMLDSRSLDTIFSTIRNCFHVAPAPEITLEANPDDLTPDSLRHLRATGFNRLSIGIQSFHDPVLEFLNRAHTGANAIASVQDARQAGFDNISIDLIYAIPGQSEADWRNNIQQALALQPEHISAYALTIEKKTVFGHRAAQGLLPIVEDDDAARQLEMLIDMLAQAGYEHYEVSNFCKPGFMSRHNSSYWRQTSYLGIGPSAHSYNNTTRQYNVSNNAIYLKTIAQNQIPAEIEQLQREDHINEYLLTTLRTNWGTDLERLRHLYHYDIDTVYAEYLETLYTQGLAVRDGHHLKLTKKGRLLADKIASDLFAEKT
jgi:oxygen-independent coproporphyrinogen-3 oxidase